MEPIWLENGTSPSTSPLMDLKTTGQYKEALTVITEQFMGLALCGTQTL